MPKPAARKNSGPPAKPARKKRSTAISRNCSACGVAKDPHVAGCPNYACPSCGMRAGNHKVECPDHPNAANVDPVLDGKTGEVLETTVDGQRAKVDARRADLGLSVDTESLLMELAKKQQLVSRLSSERGRVSNKLKEAKESLDATVATLAQRGIDLAEPTLPGVTSEYADAPDEDDEDEEDGE